jgi:orotidine-5'-phosphate decarboxylase
MSERIISADRSIILAGDQAPKQFEKTVEAIADIPGIGGVKTGMRALRTGLRSYVETVLENNHHLRVIHDYQKAGNDIPETGKDFAAEMRFAGVDAAIIFPFTGPNVEAAWIRELQEVNVTPVVGAEMTHPNIAGKMGYIKDEAFKRIFSLAIALGVRNFVVPGNKPEAVNDYRLFFERELGEGEYDLFAPGFITQGGDISETGRVAGKRWHAIVGKAIFNAADVRVAAIEHTQQILAGDTA